MGRRPLLVVTALSIVAGLFAGCAPTRYDGPVSDHFDGREFHNETPFPHEFTDLLGYLFRQERIEWSRDQTLPERPLPVPDVANGQLRLTWVNHATVLIQADGLNLLTDPIWSERASPVGFAGPERHHPAGIALEDLPPIDVVMISHSHYDHMDFPTIKRLHQVHDPLFVVPLGNAALLAPLGITRLVELDWWESVRLSNGCTLSAAQVQHWSNRRVLPSDRNLSLWAGFVLDTRAGPVYFGGDSGYNSHYRAAFDRFGPMRAALLPIGAYLPRWFMAYQHTGPQDAIRAHHDLQSAFSLGIHWGTFKLAPERRFQPAETLAAAVAESAMAPDEFRVPELGVAYEVAPLAGVAGCP